MIEKSSLCLWTEIVPIAQHAFPKRVIPVQVGVGIIWWRSFMTDWSDSPLVFDTLDMGSKAVEFFVDSFVATIDMIDAVDFGDAIGLEPSKDKGR